MSITEPTLCCARSQSNRAPRPTSPGTITLPMGTGENQAQAETPAHGFSSALTWACLGLPGPCGGCTGLCGALTPSGGAVEQGGLQQTQGLSVNEGRGLGPPSLRHPFPLRGAGSWGGGRRVPVPGQRESGLAVSVPALGPPVLGQHRL